MKKNIKTRSKTPYLTPREYAVLLGLVRLWQFNRRTTARDVMRVARMQRVEIRIITGALRGLTTKKFVKLDKTDPNNPLYIPLFDTESKPVKPIEYYFNAANDKVFKCPPVHVEGYGIDLEPDEE